MPCSYQETEAEIEARRQKSWEQKTAPLRAKLDELTHENDVLREIVLAHAVDHIPLELLEKISRAQEDHRIEDLERLMKTLNAKLLAVTKQRESLARTEEIVRIANLLLKVQTADPKKPLADQLGFDPDDY